MISLRMDRNPKYLILIEIFLGTVLVSEIKVVLISKKLKEQVRKRLFYSSCPHS